MLLYKIINARKAIEELAQKEIDGDLAYRMAKFLYDTASDQEFYASAVRKAYTNFGEQNEAAEITVPKEKEQDFRNAIEKVGNTVADDPKHKFPLSKLKEAGFTVAQIYALLDFIDEEG